MKIQLLFILLLIDSNRITLYKTVSQLKMSTNEAVSSRITRLNQLLSGKTSGKKVPLLDKETLLDAFVALYNECSTEYMTKDKNIATYVKKCEF